MDNFAVYRDIAARTGGELYIGIVGPVRTGKSTFIKRFMDFMVLPYMEEGAAKERAVDELPLSAPGSIVTTTEPKFIPKDAAAIKVSDALTVKVRLIDCVGYMAKGAGTGMPGGQSGGQTERMVKTPWLDYEIPFSKAAEIGTHKVIHDHAGIGIVVTTDGSFGELPRDAFVAAEERTIEELKGIGKPFIVLLNSENPASDACRKLAEQLEKKHQVRVIPVNCAAITREEIQAVMEQILYAFPLSALELYVPKWVEMLEADHPLKADLITYVRTFMASHEKMQDVRENLPPCNDTYVRKMRVDTIDLSNGSVKISLEFHEKYYYEIMSELAGTPIDGEYQLIEMVRSLSKMKHEYETVQSAMESVRQKGYGVVTPAKEEIKLQEPEVIKHGNKFGVKIRASSPSIHMIRADIETEIAPIVGSEEQAKDLIAFINESKQQEGGIWDTNIFGKSIEQLVDDGIRNKLAMMGEECQQKLQDTMKKIVNESSGGMVCIII